MVSKNLKIVEFMGKPIYYLIIDGVNYILIRPVCEALGVDADRQIRDMKSDELLVAGVSEQTTQLPGDSQRRSHTGLSEELIYGWLFSIKYSNTMSDETKANLTAYKMECYHVLYNHFHGKLSAAQEAVLRKVELEKERGKIHNRLLQDGSDYQRLVEIDYHLKRLGNPYQRYGNDQYKIFRDEMADESVSNN